MMIHARELCLSHRVVWCVLGICNDSDIYYSSLRVGRGEMTERWINSAGRVRHKLSVFGKSGVQFASLRINFIWINLEAPGWQGNFKTPTRSKLSLPGCGTLAPIFLHAAITNLDITVRKIYNFQWCLCGAWCAPCATLPCIHGGQNKFIGITVFASLFIKISQHY
jgi:hypothetical protein